MRRVFMLLIAALAWAVIPASGDELTPNEVAAGRKVYVAKCAKCHKFYEPKLYNGADWQRWMDSMSRKAKLKAQDDELLRRYLDEYRAGRISKAK
jgi:cytochrome c553